MKMLLAAAAGTLAAWLYRSARAREEVQRWLSTAPGPVRRTVQSAASATASGVERVAEAVEAAPVPTSVKGPVSRATETARAATEKLGGTMPAGPAGAAVLHVQQLRDGSWIANAAWDGRTLTDGGADDQLVIRRLATRLAAMTETGQPQAVKLTRVPQGGQREERETDLASLLG